MKPRESWRRDAAAAGFSREFEEDEVMQAFLEEQDRRAAMLALEEERARSLDRALVALGLLGFFLLVAVLATGHLR